MEGIDSKELVVMATEEMAGSAEPSRNYPSQCSNHHRRPNCFPHLEWQKPAAAVQNQASLAYYSCYFKRHLRPY